MSFKKNVVKALAKSVFTPLQLTEAASAADTGIHKILVQSGMRALTIQNEETDDILKIIESSEGSGLLIKSWQSN